MRGKSVGLLGTTIAEPPCRGADAELVADLVKGEGLSWHTGLLTDEELKWWEESLLLLVIVMALENTTPQGCAGSANAHCAVNWMPAGSPQRK